MTHTQSTIGPILLAAAFWFAAGSAFAEDSPLEGIQEMCLQRAGGAWTDFNPDSGHGRARTNIYSSCMIQHGMRP
jgi:hypothetical protein